MCHILCYIFHIMYKELLINILFKNVTLNLFKRLIKDLKISGEV